MMGAMRRWVAGLGMILCLQPATALAQGHLFAIGQPSADVSVAIQANTTPVARAGQALDYMLVVGNVGPSAATGVRISFSSENLTNIQVSGACGALPCMIDTLGAGYNASLYIHASVAADGPFTLTASANPRQTDPNTSNNTASVTVGPAPSKHDRAVADVSLSIQPNGSFLAQAKRAVDYQLIIGNAGPSVATAVSVTLKSDNLTAPGVSGACSRLPCTIGALSAGAKANIFVHQNVNADAPFTLLANVVDAETDPNSANNSARLTVKPTVRSRSGDNTTAGQADGQDAVSPDVDARHNPPGPDPGLVFWLLVAAGSLTLSLATKAVVDARRRARWLRQLSLIAVRGAEGVVAAGPLPFVAPTMVVTVSCARGQAGPRGPAPILKVVNDA
jgi:uncharacterized repeat protein (TIGR01451 family)